MKWINVHDYLPEYGRWVLVQSDWGKISMARYYHHFNWQNPKIFQSRFELACYECLTDKTHNAELRPVAWMYFDDLEPYKPIKTE